MKYRDLGTNVHLAGFQTELVGAGQYRRWITRRNANAVRGKAGSDLKPRHTGDIALLALQAAFIAMKLADVGAVATWSWLWVLSPLWLTWTTFSVVAIVWEFIRSKKDE